MCIRDRARAASSAPPTEETISQLATPLIESMRERVPGASFFDAEVLLSAFGIAGATAVRAYLSLPEPRDPEEGRKLVRRAYRVLREAV